MLIALWIAVAVLLVGCIGLGAALYMFLSAIVGPYR